MRFLHTFLYMSSRLLCRLWNKKVYITPAMLRFVTFVLKERQVFVFSPPQRLLCLAIAVKSNEVIRCVSLICISDPWGSIQAGDCGKNLAGFLEFTILFMLEKSQKWATKIFLLQCSAWHCIYLGKDSKEHLWAWKFSTELQRVEEWQSFPAEEMQWGALPYLHSNIIQFQW